LFGLSVDGNRLTLDPRLPAEWPGVRIDYRHGNTVYAIAVSRGGQPALIVDGTPVEGGAIALQDGGGTRQVEVVVGR
jgi:cellobiose phosphorylase